MPRTTELLQRELSLFRMVCCAASAPTATSTQEAALVQSLASSWRQTWRNRSVCASRLHAAQSDGVEAQPRRSRLSGTPSSAGHLRLGVAIRDAFISWDVRPRACLGARYFNRACAAGCRWARTLTRSARFRMMGLQSPKGAWAFLRASVSRRQAAYLVDAPRFIGYVRTVVQRYNELTPLARLFDELGLT